MEANWVMQQHHRSVLELREAMPMLYERGTHDKSSKKYDDMDCELSDATCQSTVSGK
jgi:hypothetical protein